MIDKLFGSKYSHNQGQLSILGNFCKDKLLHKKLMCCQKTKRQKALEEALSELEKETDIIKMIKSRRFFSHAIKHLIKDKKHRKELKTQSLSLVFGKDHDQTMIKSNNLQVS